MRITRLLIANRGEIAIRIARTAADLGIRTVGVFAEDDTTSLHRRHVDDARGLRGSGPRAYLDVEQLLAVARDAGCDAVHPGYGFLSEQAAFARRCTDTGLVFVGPRAETLALLGDKVAARALAARCGVPVPRGTDAAVSLDEARVFLAALGPDTAIVVKAVAADSASSGDPMSSMTRGRAAARKRRPPSATTRSTSRSCCRGCGTSRSRSSATERAP